NWDIGVLAAAVRPVAALFAWNNPSEANWKDILKDVVSHCYIPGTTMGVEGYSQCLTGNWFTPQHSYFWQDVWTRLGDSTKYLNELWTKYATESGSPNIMMAKLAACDGSWGQSDFARFADKCGFKMMSLQFDVLNDKTPLYNKSYYQSMLQTMNCQANTGNGFPFDRDVLSG
ncbi:MAG: hypothetical protein JNL57_04415, partial [Bacteroidetes bacterium]|nr:hypothetical protein [Bacteroidota bacterium]